MRHLAVLPPSDKLRRINRILSFPKGTMPGDMLAMYGVVHKEFRAIHQAIEAAECAPLHAPRILGIYAEDQVAAAKAGIAELFVWTFPDVRIETPQFLALGD